MGFTIIHYTSGMTDERGNRYVYAVLDWCVCLCAWGVQTFVFGRISACFIFLILFTRSKPGSTFLLAVLLLTLVLPLTVFLSWFVVNGCRCVLGAKGVQ